MLDHICSWGSQGKSAEVVCHSFLQWTTFCQNSPPWPVCLLLNKKQRHYFASKGPSSQGCGFSSSHVQMWELDYKESWAQKSWCFWTVVLEKTLESPLDCMEIQPVHPKGDQSWVFIEKADVEAETPILWPPDVKSWLTWKDPDAGKGWRQEEKGMTEDERVGWHHQLKGHAFEQTAGDSGQGSLACCSSWGRKESNTTERLNWTEISTNDINLKKNSTLSYSNNLII